VVPSIQLVSIAALAQALIGLGTGRSPSSSGCSPSAQTLLSRAQSRSSTLSSEPIMHFLTRPSCRGPLVKFRRRFSGCPVPWHLGSQTGLSLKGGYVMPSLMFTLLIDPQGEEQCSYRLANLQNTLPSSLTVNCFKLFLSLSLLHSRCRRQTQLKTFQLIKQHQSPSPLHPHPSLTPLSSP
jgi:hypothetical protein